MACWRSLPRSRRCCFRAGSVAVGAEACSDHGFSGRARHLFRFRSPCSRLQTASGPACRNCVAVARAASGGAARWAARSGDPLSRTCFSVEALREARARLKIADAGLETAVLDPVMPVVGMVWIVCAGARRDRRVLHLVALRAQAGPVPIPYFPLLQLPLRLLIPSSSTHRALPHSHGSRKAPAGWAAQRHCRRHATAPRSSGLVPRPSSAVVAAADVHYRRA